MTIQMKAVGQYFPVVLSVMLSVQGCSNFSFESVDDKKKKKNFSFESVDDIVKCDHSNEGYRAVLRLEISFRKGLVASGIWF